MSNQAYVGTAKRTFAQALRHVLETEYSLLGSGRVLDLLAGDVQRLAEQFYPVPEHLPSGWMVFTGTRAKGGKLRPGQCVDDHELVTLAWPVLTTEDIQSLPTHPKGAEGIKTHRAWLQQRLIRIVEYGWNQSQGPVLLTLADLSAMLGLSTVEVSQLLSEARCTTGKALITKGYYFDQGMRPTHKTEIITLYEAGVDEAEIARQTQHSPASVGHYIRDYERVRLLLKPRTPVQDIGRLLDMRPGVVKAYLGMIHQYHPELMSEEISLPPT